MVVFTASLETAMNFKFLQGKSTSHSSLSVLCVGGGNVGTIEVVLDMFVE